MKRVLSMAVAVCTAIAVRAQAAPSSGVDVVWLAPRDGSEIDLDSFRLQPISLTAPYRLSATKWLTTTLKPGELAWIRIEDDLDEGDVRFARLGTDDNTGVLTALRPVRTGAHDFLVAAPLGPPMQLALQARSASALPRVQIWLAAARSPGYRWELWEDAAKRWAHAPAGLPPAPPDELARDLVEQLAVVADAIARAGRQDETDRRAASAALLTAEALLGAAPSREPVFPYATRSDLTQEIADASGLQHFEQDDGQVAELPAGHSLRFTLSGPGALRVDAHALLGPDDDSRSRSFDMVLRSGGRVVAFTSDPLSLGAQTSDPAAEHISSLRRLVAAAPAGAREYVLEARGANARIQIFLHRRVMHIEDAISGSEDIAALLERARSEAAPGLLHELLAAEAAFADRRADAARTGFAHVYAEARDVALQAFALGRMAAVTQDAGTASTRSRAALALLDRQLGESIARLRDVLALDGVVRALADGDVAAARELSQRVASMPVRFPFWAGAALRGRVGARAEALSVLGSAVRAHPLDRRLLRAASREWWIGTRWATLPLESGPAALASDVVMRSSSVSCARASQDGSAAFAALPEREVELHVSETQATAPYLRRFHVLALRSDGSHGLGRVELTLDAESSSLPVLPAVERIAFALDQGVHHLRAHYDRGQVLVPCSLLGESSLAQPLYVERSLVTLPAAGANVRATLPDPGRRAYIAIDVYPAPGAPHARLRVRADGAELATLEVHGNPRASRGAIGPGLPFTLEVPAGAQRIDVQREDAGAPLSLRVLVRTSSPIVEAAAPRAPAHTADAGELAALGAATRAVRLAEGASTRAQARLARAKLLARVGMGVRARSEIARALPFLDDAGASEARALLAWLHAPSLLAAPDGRHGVLLAPAAGLNDEPAAVACVDRALETCANAAADCQAALAACPSATAAYVAARLLDRSGSVAAAAEQYARSVSLGAPSGIADEAAQRLLDAADAATGDPSAARLQAFALATQADQTGDAHASYAVQRARSYVQWKPLLAVEGGTPISLPAVTSTPAVAQALTQPPWSEDAAVRLLPGREVNSLFELRTPTSVLVEAFCERGGAAPDEPERCPVTLEVDGVPSSNPLRSGEITNLGEQLLAAGEHRIVVRLAREAADAQIFVRVTTSRPIGDPRGTMKTPEGRFLLGGAARTTRRALLRANESVDLALDAPVTLRVDGVFGRARGTPRALDLSVVHAGGRITHEHREVCGAAEERLVPPLAERFDCHAVVLFALDDAGATRVTLSHAGANEAALAFATTAPAAGGGPAPPAQEPVAGSLPDAGALPAPPALAQALVLPDPLSAPRDNLPRMLGTLQVRLREAYGSQAGQDPRVGDRFQELAVTYRRKLDELPVWLQGAGLLRRGDGSASQGLELLAFVRIPSVQLRVLNRLGVFTQPYEHNLESSLRYESYVERSFETFPRFFVLPRLALTASERSLSSRPALRVTGNEPLDPSVWNSFSARHPFGTYGQVLLWWVPYLNVIVFGHARATSSPSVTAIDRYTLQAGLDLVFGTTELIGTYTWSRLLAGESRRNDATHHDLGAAIDQSLWLTGQQRLGLRASGSTELSGPHYAVSIGVFWEGSFDRGLDDYSTPEVNFPVQLGRGRAIPTPERSLQ